MAEKWADTDAFIEWGNEKILYDKWSPDTVVGFAKRHGLFVTSIIPYLATLYGWIDREIIRMKNIDLLKKVSRNPKVSTQKKRQMNAFLVHQLIIDHKKLIPL